MKAAVYEQFGGPEVVTLREVPTPEPGPGQVRVKLAATAVTAADHRARSGELPPGFGMMRPLALGLFKRRHPILGMDFAGTVDAVGAGVTRFVPGHAVFGTTGFAFGCHAEYVCIDAQAGIAPLPEGLGFAEAAAILFGGATTLYFFGHAEPGPGRNVLINGASGSVGTAMVQYARRAGAMVTGITSGGNADLVRNLGADMVIDYTREDFAANGQHYDYVIDCVGNIPFARARGSLANKGNYFIVVGSLGTMLLGAFAARRAGHGVAMGSGVLSAGQVAQLGAMALDGSVRPVIDTTYPFSEIQAAHAHVDTGRKRGNVVITF